MRKQRCLSISRRNIDTPLVLAPYILYADDTLSGYIQESQNNGQANRPQWTTIPLATIEKIQTLPTRFNVLPDFVRQHELSKEGVVYMVAG